MSSDPIFKASQAPPSREYFLQGSILENQRELLLNRLKGLCDMAESVPEKFSDHEMVFSLRGPPSIQPVVLHVRHALLDRTASDEPWNVRFSGQLDSSDAIRHTMTRTIIDMGTTPNITQFLSEMGFTLDFEYVAKGYVFRKGWLKTTVSKLHKLVNPGNVEQVEQISNLNLVELSVISTQGQERIAEEMKNFAEQLKPLVVLEKLDHRKLPQ